jgi:hypothetical protein
VKKGMTGSEDFLASRNVCWMSCEAIISPLLALRCFPRPFARASSFAWREKTRIAVLLCSDMVRGCLIIWFYD